jgi:type VI secretion system secreted protein VgrG
MAEYTQANRLLTVATPLGKDALLLSGFQGHEAFSQLFHYDLELLSENDHIAPRDILGKQVTWAVNHVHSEPRSWSGHVHGWVAGDQNARGLRVYRAEVVPWLWFLTLTSDCRIFQNQSTLDILKTLFAEHGFHDYSFAALHGTYARRTYCVQYRETTLDFVARLLEQEGIFYFFKHEEGKHTLVLGDRVSAYKDCPEKEVKLAAAAAAPNHLTSWEHRHAVRSGKWSLTDYNFETPATNLGSSSKMPAAFAPGDKLERFDYPGLYGRTEEGKVVTRLHMEEEETGLDVASAGGGCCTFVVGGMFRLTNHSCPSENQAYVITSIRHTATDPSYEPGGAAASYSNTFTCIPAAVVFRPARTTASPLIAGLQTAVVVGPTKEEIYCDKYGRVKVQFHWDRRGKRDENSSCWVRVAQVWAGKGWGAFFWPRIGHEVVVAFEEGNPDRPLIVGSVYHAANMPPFQLPLNNMLGGIKSCTVRGSAHENYNGIVFDDEKGREHLSLHSERHLSFNSELDKLFKSGRHKAEHVSGVSLSTTGNLLPAGGGSGGGPDPYYAWTPPQATGWLGLNGQVVYGQNLQYAIGLNHQAALGSNLQMCISDLRSSGNPQALSPMLASGLGGNMQLTLGCNVQVVVGRSFNINLGPTTFTVDVHANDHPLSVLCCDMLIPTYIVWGVLYGLFGLGSNASDQNSARAVTTCIAQILVDVILAALMQTEINYKTFTIGQDIIDATAKKDDKLIKDLQDMQAECMKITLSKDFVQDNTALAICTVGVLPLVGDFVTAFASKTDASSPPPPPPGPPGPSGPAGPAGPPGPGVPTRPR